MKFVRTNQPLRKMASTNQEVYQICTDEKFRRLRIKRLTVFMFREIKATHVFHEHEMNMSIIFFFVIPAVVFEPQQHFTRKTSKNTFFEFLFDIFFKFMQISFHSLYVLDFKTSQL